MEGAFVAVIAAIIVNLIYPPATWLNGILFGVVMLLGLTVLNMRQKR